MAHRSDANFVYMLLGLLAIIVAGPLVSEFTDQPPLLITHVAFSVTLIVCVWSLLDSRKWFIAGITLAVADLTATAVHLLSPTAGVELITHLIELAFIGLSFVFSLSYVLRGDGMNANRVIGAICVYLLLGVFVAILNLLLFQYVPDSFRGIDISEESTAGINLMYYTFVTLTTLGYGDVTPVGPLARTLAYLAAIAGQFYIAILVAMVVGEYLSHKKRAD